MSYDARLRKLPKEARLVFRQAAEAWLNELELAQERRKGYELTDAQGYADLATLEVPDPGDPMYTLGKLTEVTYAGKHRGAPVEYFHRFEKPLPMLTSSLSGRLFIVGGGYRISPHGIVG